MFGLFDTMPAERAKQLSPVTLAFVGDAVYSLYVRHRLVDGGDLKPAHLQKLTSECVSAHGQSELLEKISGKFTEEEEAVFHRGRNAKKATKSKNASVAEYNRSTGFEAVLGYHYLTGNYDRIAELLEADDENRG